MLNNLNAQADLSVLEELIVINNNSSESYASVEGFIAANPQLPVHYHYSGINLGVSGGRNMGIKIAKAPIIVFLDDDAEFDSTDSLKTIAGIFAKQSQQDTERPLGALAMKVLYASTGEMQKNAFPHKEFDDHKNLHQFNAPYFVGCAHAISKEVFEATGLYPENFFYGMEEYDLSYRIIDCGYRICYSDEVVVLHKESPEGRLPAPKKLRGMWVNKSKVAWKYLPKKYYLTTAVLWSLFFLRQSKFKIGDFLAGWKEIISIPQKEHRKPIGKAALAYLKEVKARLRY